MCAGCSQREISPGSGGLLWPRVDVGVRHSNHNAERRTLRVHEAPAGGAVRKSHLLVMIITIRNLKITLCLMVSIETIHWYNDLITAVTGLPSLQDSFYLFVIPPKTSHNFTDSDSEYRKYRQIQESHHRRHGSSITSAPLEAGPESQRHHHARRDANAPVSRGTQRREQLVDKVTPFEDDHYDILSFYIAIAPWRSCMCMKPRLKLVTETMEVRFISVPSIPTDVAGAPTS